MSKRRRKSEKRAKAATSVSWTERIRSRVRITVMSYAPVIGLFVVTRVALAEAYRIPSGSMEPTLQVGDWLFVNKLRFGPHIPFSSMALPGYATPKRNDIAVFVSPPQDPSIRITPRDVTPTLVKRIVGLGRDTLMMRQGRLSVNGVDVPARNTDYLLPESVAGLPQPLFEWQHAIEVRGSRFGPPVERPSVHEWGPIVVPAGMLFMMGDNRDNSVDSRYYGPVPRENLRGTPMFVYYSYSPEEGVDYLRALTAIRWRRLGTWIR